MTGTITPAAGEGTILAITLRPHRSLSRRGFVTLMAVFAGLLLLPGIGFFAIGAWPIVGFMGLDVAIVFLAFRLSFRAARAAQEIEVTRRALTVRNVTPAGRRTETTLNPYWARLEIARRPEVGIVRMELTSHGVRLEIGRFLPLPEREPVADALTAALARARGA